jgi:hypothetical protein
MYSLNINLLEKFESHPETVAIAAPAYYTNRPGYRTYWQGHYIDLGLLY